MSWPPEVSTSSFSPDSVETELGTSLTFSARRSAVTVTVCSTPGALAAGAAGLAVCAQAAGTASKSDEAVRAVERRTRRVMGTPWQWSADLASDVPHVNEREAAPPAPGLR